MVRHVEFSGDAFLVEGAINHEGKIVETSKTTRNLKIQIGLTTQRQATSTTHTTAIFYSMNTINLNGTRAARLNHGTHKTELLLSDLPIIAAPVMPLVTRLVNVINELQHNMGRSCTISDKTIQKTR